MEDYKDDGSVPLESELYFKDSYFQKQIGIFFILLVLVIIVLFNSGFFTILLFGTTYIAGAFSVLDYENIDDWRNNKVQLRLNEEGIDVVSSELGLVDWDEVIDFNIDLKKGLLTFGYQDENFFHEVKCQLKKLTISNYSEFKRRVDVYKNRYRKNYPIE